MIYEAFIMNGKPHIKKLSIIIEKRKRERKEKKGDKKEKKREKNWWV